ncbi:MAG TPA: hypothetical protein VLG17_12580 [Pseudomonas sp.]|uniref:hypothetical protein n=1 Tax=Pseudomonas sp. TaxID=306 RepID=UPI002B5802D3|nr:hypothetical protein [Pseudomonas sp.]HSX88817.1 hypothetical protein [Pseudomonas sp.]
MKRILLAVFAVFCFFNGVSQASQSHLIPDAAHVAARSGYQEKLRYTFRDAYKKDVVLQALIMPSFGSEYVIGLRRASGGYEVFHQAVEFKVSIFERIEREGAGDGEVWEYTLPKNLPKDFRRNPINMIERTIEAPLAIRIADIWAEALLDVRRGRGGDLSLDGIYYTYSMFLNGYGFVSGSSNNPRPDTKMYALAQIVEALKKYAQGDLVFEELENIVALYEKNFLGQIKSSQ